MCLDAQSRPTLCDLMDCSPPGSSVHWDSPGKNTGVGCCALLQGSSQPRDQTQVSHIAGRFFTIWATRKWVAYPFSRVSSQSRIEPGSLCIAGGFFTSWATREAHIKGSCYVAEELSKMCTFPEHIEFRSQIREINIDQIMMLVKE